MKLQASYCLMLSHCVFNSIRFKIKLSNYFQRGVARKNSFLGDKSQSVPIWSNLSKKLLKVHSTLIDVKLHFNSVFLEYPICDEKTANPCINVNNFAFLKKQIFFSIENENMFQDAVNFPILDYRFSNLKSSFINHICLNHLIYFLIDIVNKELSIEHFVTFLF